MNANIQVASSGIVYQPFVRRKSAARETWAKRFAEQGRHAYPEVSVPESTIDVDNLRHKYRGSYKEASSHEEKVALYARAASVQNLLVTWMLVADDEKAQIYECYKTEHAKADETREVHYYDEQSGQSLVAVPNGFIKADSVWDCQMKRASDNLNSSGDVVRNADELQRVVQEELNRQFLRTIAAKLQAAYAANAYDRLIFSVPTGMIAAIKERLSFNVQDCIVATHGY
ncbi:MAG: host attachment protein [Alphaproteobacteria bacterium]